MTEVTGPNRPEPKNVSLDTGENRRGGARPQRPVP